MKKGFKIALIVLLIVGVLLMGVNIARLIMLNAQTPEDVVNIEIATSKIFRCISIWFLGVMSVVWYVQNYLNNKTKSKLVSLIIVAVLLAVALSLVIYFTSVPNLLAVVISCASMLVINVVHFVLLQRKLVY